MLEGRKTMLAIQLWRKSLEELKQQLIAKGFLPDDGTEEEITGCFQPVRPVVASRLANATS